MAPHRGPGSGSGSESAPTVTALAMPPVPNRDDLDATWEFLEVGVTKIMLNLQDGLDRTAYMGLYTAVHNFCTSPKAMSPVATEAFGAAHHGAHLVGEELYNHLKTYLTGHLRDVYQSANVHTDETLLAVYIREWNRYTTAAKYINHLFSYLNRHWVKREMDEGKKNVYDVYTLHLVRWKTDLFMHVQEPVMAAVLRLVEKQRNGETVEQTQIKKIVNSFVLLGMDDSDARRSTLDVYRYHFERPYLDSTTKFYQAESKQFLAENSIVDYMKKAETRLDEERDRVGLYLHPDIMNPLMRACQSVLIAEHAPLLRDEFQSLLDHDRQDDLARMYKLLSKIGDGLDPLRTRFEAHVRKAGLAAVSKVTPGEDSIEPKVYVEALLQVHGHYQQLVSQAFQGDTEFVRSLDNACREFVNRNEVCKSGSSKSPELLARYTDMLLKKGSKSVEESDLEDMLTQIVGFADTIPQILSRLHDQMTIFKYIEDKDVFQRFYSRMLAKRLVHVSSASDDAEESMIGKLKEACGFEYTNKLQRMFQDMRISHDLNDQFREHIDQLVEVEDEKGTPGTVDTTFYILGTGFWPLVPPTSPFIPPTIIVRTYEQFQKFYYGKHNGRKLTWLWNLCKGEVKANYIKGTRVPYTFQVSTYQIALLLLFNDRESIRYEDMEEATSLPREILDPSLALFLKSKVMLTEPEGGKVESGTVFVLNYNFKNKKVRVNLNFQVKSEQKQEVEDTHKTIEEDRKLLTQSAIVRIMKSRKKMKHVSLVQETIEQLNNRFSPQVSDIKKCIDILLDKEYLERLDGDELGYLA